MPALMGGRMECEQAVFTLLDTLKQWLEDKRPPVSAATGAIQILTNPPEARGF